MAEKISEQVERELDEEEQLKKEIVRLHLLYEMDQISEAELSEREAELLERLRNTEQKYIQIGYADDESDDE